MEGFFGDSDVMTPQAFQILGTRWIL